MRRAGRPKKERRYVSWDDIADAKIQVLLGDPIMLRLPKVDDSKLARIVEAVLSILDEDDEQSARSP